MDAILTKQKQENSTSRRTMEGEQELGMLEVESSDRAQELLIIFSKVRDRLHHEGGITALPLDFPIRELNHVPTYPLCPSSLALSLNSDLVKDRTATWASPTHCTGTGRRWVEEGSPMRT
jgi:hypothetical protein